VASQALPLSNSPQRRGYEVLPQWQRPSGTLTLQVGQGPGWQSSVHGCGQEVPVRIRLQVLPQLWGVA